MELRLYKNCKLTQEYDNVFNSKSVFESYLETLDATAYDINLETSYYSVQSDGTGSIPIDFNYVSDGQILGHINEYNYIRFTDSNYNIVRYCFVTSIAIQNGIAIINYLEDIWHNYVYGINIERCIITQQRNNTNTPAKNIIDFTSNRPPLINKYTDYSGSVYCIIVKGQIYNTTTSGSINNRTPFVGGVFWHNSELGYFYTNGSADDTNDILAFIYKAAQTQDSVNIRVPFGNVSGNNNLDITDVYIIPRAFIENKFEQDIARASIQFNDQFTLNSRDYTMYIALLEDNNVLQKTVEVPISLNDDSENYKIISVGNYSITIPIAYDGMSIECAVYYICDGNTFSLFYAINKQMVEITECYNYNYPINIETAENLQLKKINRKLENDTYERNKTTLVTDTARGTAGFIGGLVSLFSGNISGGIQTMVGGAAQPVDSYIVMKNAQQKLVNITNAGLYTSNTAISATSNAYLNATVDIVIYYIDSTNDSIVQDITSNFGRVCNVYIDSLITSGIITVASMFSFEYYVIDKCDITGDASNDVLIKIKRILKRGVRIWRKTNL